MKELPKYSIILPVKNQADHIEHVVVQLRKCLKRLNIMFELILVVNGSKDQSLPVCQKIAKNYDDIMAIESNESGWGASLLRGLEKAQGEFIGFVNSARIKERDLLTAITLTEQYPNFLVKGRRIIRSSKMRKIASAIYNLENRIFHKIKVKDVNGTPKIMSKKQLINLSLVEKGDLFDLELLSRVFQQNISVIEFDILNNERNGGRSTTGLLSALKMYLGSISLWRKMNGQNKNR